MPTSTDSINLCQQALIILILPLAAFLVQIFFSRRIPPKWLQGAWIPTGAMGIAVLIALKMFFIDLLGASEGIERQLWYPMMNWIRIGPADDPDFVMHFGILVDSATIAMLFVVTVVSFLVHLYSIGYMKGEVRFNRFFAFLALFTFSMLGLCITSNLLFLFIFWELVGVCSYFLIGFYFEKKSAQNASIKAFITTRIGDLGFFLAILIISAVAGSLEFDDIFKSVEDGKWSATTGVATIGLATTAILLFFGAMGKSGQFPLHIWLPDAMEGPTPVSALIHAATMVAAGVYLVARMFPFFAGEGYFTGNFWDSDALLFVAWIGGFTSIFAASIAFVQTDLKKVLAYSTVSQLGYMMLAIGCGSVAFGLFHLTTHAMFKALLFLGSGSVIHAVHSNEMTDMGGLWKKMKITWATYLVATLCIAGLPFVTSGFWSKEGILTQALAAAEYNGWYYPPFIFGMITAGLTACYMFRLFFKTFHGEPKDAERYAHAHESPLTMTIPLVALAVLAIYTGFATGSPEWFEHRVASETLTGNAPAANHDVLGNIGDLHANHLVLWLSLVALSLGVGAAWFFFWPSAPGAKKNMLAPQAPLGKALAPLTYCLKNLWFVDAFFCKFFLGLLHFFRYLCGIFDALIVDGIVNLQGWICRSLGFLAGKVDNEGVDGAVRGLGKVTLRGGRAMRKIQTGKLQEYLYASVYLAAGVVVVALVVFFLIRSESGSGGAGG